MLKCAMKKVIKAEGHGRVIQQFCTARGIKCLMDKCRKTPAVIVMEHGTVSGICENHMVDALLALGPADVMTVSDLEHLSSTFESI